MSHHAVHPSYPAQSRPVHRPPQARAAVARNGADYTLGHAGRQVRIGPVAFWIVVGTLVIMAVWSAATATYFAFHDDVLTRLIARQSEMQVAYEDRISDLRGQIDRITSRQLLDQEKFETNLGEILRRQAALEQRAGALSNVADPTVTGSIRPASKQAPSVQTPSAVPKPSPISDTVIFTAPPEREARLESRVPRIAALDLSHKNANIGMAGTLVRLRASLDRVEARQTATLDALEEQYDSKIKRMRTVLAELGLDPAKLPVPAGPVGGPFVPVKPPLQAGPFERQVYRIALARSQADKLTRSLITVPLRKPIVGDVDLSSGFGVRSDPFLGRPAMHTGLDFRGDTGDPVQATANGTVTLAGWQGGYGRMIEIDHGNGLTTRYGHLSEIGVRVGQVVGIGQVIGRVGSTGRSTGPHLHYETRIDGDAVDPQKFLRAGMRIGPGLL